MGNQDIVLIIVIGILYLIVAGMCSSENKFATGCNNEKLRLVCPHNHIIGVKRIFYGVKKNRECGISGRNHSQDCCTRTHNDCIVFKDERYTPVNTVCSGLRTCNLRVEAVKTNQKCDDKSVHLTDYMTVIYNCVPVKQVARFCSNDHHRGKEIYLFNANYPYSFGSSVFSCQCLLKSNKEGFTVRAIDITILDDDKGAKCGQQIQIQDGYGRRQTIGCGYTGMFGYRPIYDRVVSNITITIESAAATGSRGYVWLLIHSQHADEDVSLYCGESINNLLLNSTRVSTIPPDSLNDTVGLVASTWETPHLIPDMIAIIAGIGAAATLIFIVCLIAIVVHCTKSRYSRESNVPKVPEVIPSPMLRSKEFEEDVPNTIHERYNYDEDRYCTIKRAPLKMTRYPEFDEDTDAKLKEAFLQYNGDFEDKTLMNGVPPRPPSPDPALLDEALMNETPPPAYNGHSEKYYTMHLHKPKSEIAEIRVTSTLPMNGKTRGKGKSVTFSPVALVTPLPSESEDSLESENDLNLANVIDIYQHLQDDANPTQFSNGRKIVLLSPMSEENLPPPPPQSMAAHSHRIPDNVEMAEVEQLWKTIIEPQSDSTTMDEGAYDNIEYLLRKNRLAHEDDHAKQHHKQYETGV